MKKFLLTTLAILTLSIAGWAIVKGSALFLAESGQEAIVDLTSKIINPQFQDGETGWTLEKIATTDTGGTPSTGVKGPTENKVITAFNTTVDCHQTIEGLEPGDYKLCVQAFARPAAQDQTQSIADNAATIQYDNYIYANDAQQLAMLITADGATTEQSQCLKVTVDGKSLWVPTSSSATSALFSMGLYDQALYFTVGEDGIAKIGVKGSIVENGGSYYAFDNFRLYKINALPSEDVEALLATVPDGAMNAQVKSALDAAIKALKDEATMSNYKNATKAVEDAKASAAVYAEIKKTIDIAEAKAAAMQVELDLADVKAAYENGTIEGDGAQEIAAIKEAPVKAYFKHVKPGDDITGLLQNTTFDNNNLDGWDVTGGLVSKNHVARSFEANYDASQTLTGVAPGTYKLEIQIFGRGMSNADMIAAVKAGTELPSNNTVFYANKIEKAAAQITDESLAEKGTGNWTEMPDGTWIPDNAASTEVVFAAGLYKNELTVEVGEEGILKIGVKMSGDHSGRYSGFDNVKLTYVGSNEVALANADFAQGAVGNGVVIFTTAADITAGNVGHLQEVPGWQFGIENKDGMSGGVMAYGSGAMIGKGDKPAYTVPAEGPEGTNGYALALAANNSNTAQYVQDVVLTPGKYTMTAKVLNTVGTESVKNLIGVKFGGNEVYADATSFEVGKWLDQVVEFEVAEESTVTVSLGFQVGSGGTSNKPHLFIDNVKIVRTGSIEPSEDPEVGEPVRLALTGGSPASNELAIKVLKESESGSPLVVKYTVTNGTWGNNASHLSFFKYNFSAADLEGYDKIGVQFYETVATSTGDPTYGFIPVGLVSPVNWTSMNGRNEWIYTISDKDKAEGIDDFSLFYNASGSLKDFEVIICGLYLMKEGQEMPERETIKEKFDVTGFENLTAKIANPNFDNGQNGWTINSCGRDGGFEVKAASTGNPVVTAYNYLLDISQTISGLEPGKYAVLVNACSRHMDGADGIKDYEAKKAKGEEIQNEAYVYANGIQKKVVNIYDETSTYDFATESGQKLEVVRMSNGEQIPYNSTNFAHAFGELEMYENYVICNVGKNGILTLGIKNELQASGCTPYIAFDNFRLYRMGDAEEEEGAAFDLYDLMAEAGTYVPVCMPYAVKSEYFGQVYKIAQIQDGKAVLVPTESVASGEPCVIKANGEHNVKEGDVVLSYNAPKATVSMWDNTMMQGDLNKLTWTATAIDGSKIKVADLTYTEADLSNMDFTCTIENNAAARFWAQNPDYAAETPTQIGKFLNLPAYNRTDQPNPITIPVVAAEKDQLLSYSLDEDMLAAETVTVPAGKTVAEIYNLLPGLTYYYNTADGKSAGKFTVGGTLRMIMIGKNVVNMRDLGGKKTVDGRYVKYGKIYRNAEFKGGTFNIDATELQKLLDLNIGAELDLRNEDGNKPWLPNAKRGDNFYWAEGKNYIANGPGKMYDAVAIPHLKAEFETVVNNLRKGVAVDFHCRIGADRTGFLAFLLEGLLGVSESDILRDYETTSFSEAGLRTKADGDGDAAASSYEKVIPAEFRSKIPEGGNLRDVFEAYFINTLGVDKALIDEYRDIMLAESPIADVQAEQTSKYIAVLRNEITNAGLYVWGDDFGQYTMTDQSAVDKYMKTAEAAELFLNESEGVALESLKEQIKGITAAGNDMKATISLNMPKAGDQMYLISKAYGKYIMPRSKTNYTVQNAEADKCIFTYDGEHLVSNYTDLTFGYDAKGKVASAVKVDGAEPTLIVPSQNGTIGCYNIMIGDYTLMTVGTTGTMLPALSETNADADIIIKRYVKPDAILDVEMAGEPSASYNLAGQKVSNGYKGIIIRDGKKLMVK